MTTSGTAADLGLAYLGDVDSHHCENFVTLMQSQGAPVHCLRDSRCYPGQRIGAANASPLARRLRQVSRLVTQFRGASDPAYISSLLRQVDACGIRTVVAFWGTQVMADVVALKRRRPNIRIVLNVLCHPTAITRPKAAVQNWFLRIQVRHCDGLIASSPAMETYLRQHVLAGRAVPLLIWPPFLSGSHQPKRRLPGCENRPNLLFLGRMDWKRAQETDNVTGMLMDLMDKGVHVYYHRAPESTISHPNGHAFDYMSLQDAIVHSTQFDASLVLYRLDAGTADDRFRVTVPDRLVASVAGGVPIAIPASGYDACKQYLKNYPAMIEFNSSDDLAAQLRDRSRIERLRDIAVSAGRCYAGEDHARALVCFLREL